MKQLITACALVVAAAGCYRIPPSVRTFAADLPVRAGGQYAALDDILRQQLVSKDALLQCRIDREDGKAEAESAACRCALSTGPGLSGCADWLGDHAPAETTSATTNP